MTHYDMMKKVEEYDAFMADKEKSNTIVVRSFRIAKQLVEQYGFFGHLINVRKDREDPELKRHVWLFRKDERIDRVFRQLVEQARSMRENDKIET